MLKRIIFIYCILTNYLIASDIIVAVASNVSYAIDDLEKEFNKLHPEINIKFILGSSGKLSAQIVHGAPYQLFMSANMKLPKALYDRGLTTAKPVVYAQGMLCYLSNTQQDFSQGIRLLLDEDIKTIAIANPKTAPYGEATLEAILSAGIYNKIKHKLVYAESISQTLSYTINATDIGFIAKSLLYSPKMLHYKKGIHYLDVDIKLYRPINQGIVLLKQAQANSDAKAFYLFMQSKKAKQILTSYGYLAS